MRHFMGIFLLCTGVSALGQDLRNIFIDENQNGKIFSAFLEEMERTYNVDFIFDVAQIQAYTVNGITGRQRLLEFLDKFLVHHTVTRISNKVVFIVERSPDKFGDRRDDFIVLKKPVSDEVTVQGQLIDSGNGEPIIGAQVRVDELNSGTLTDMDGNFSLRLSTDRIYHLTLQYVGYESYHYIIGFSPYASETRIEASLFPESKQLESVIVTAEQIDVNVKGELSGMQRLNIETIKSIPTFMGEVDPVRSLTTLPGVSTAGELASGFNVRGGEAGQNLILQDGAPIYNPSHLFGFFSAFNPDMVSDVSLYKGGGPANFGGRVSSVLKVDLKNGDAGKHTVSGGVGLVSSRLSVEGPLHRGKSSYMIGGRLSYTNWLIHATRDVQLKQSAANFYDLTGKLFFTINDKNFLSITGYASHDDFRLATDSVFSWGTLNASLRWDHT
ncbi:MAG TPA: carboxypeptidase-like regulatory domain-containing protein, partial [Cyclobacteriaceae bacterium]